MAVEWFAESAGDAVAVDWIETRERRDEKRAVRYRAAKRPNVIVGLR